MSSRPAKLEGAHGELGRKSQSYSVTQWGQWGVNGVSFRKLRVEGVALTYYHGNQTLAAQCNQVRVGEFEKLLGVGKFQEIN